MVKSFQEFINEDRKLSVVLKVAIDVKLWSTLDNNGYSANEVKGGDELNKLTRWWGEEEVNDFLRIANPGFDADYIEKIVNNILKITIGNNTITLIYDDKYVTVEDLKKYFWNLVDKYSIQPRGNLQDKPNYIDLGGSDEFYPVKGQSDNDAELDGALILIKSYKIQ
jgi:hypothetical protein